MNENEYAKVVAKNLKRIAYERGKTQADISRDLGISKQTLSSWMNGQRLPRMQKIDLLCHYFNCLREDIVEPHADNFYYGGELKRMSAFDSDLIDAYRAAPDYVQKAILTLLGMEQDDKNNNSPSP